LAQHAFGIRNWKTWTNRWICRSGTVTSKSRLLVDSGVFAECDEYFLNMSHVFVIVLLYRFKSGVSFTWTTTDCSGFASLHVLVLIRLRSKSTVLKGFYLSHDPSPELWVHFPFLRMWNLPYQKQQRSSFQSTIRQSIDGRSTRANDRPRFWQSGHLQTCRKWPIALLLWPKASLCQSPKSKNCWLLIWHQVMIRGQVHANGSNALRTGQPGCRATLNVRKARAW
jgi:hypothetical protein